MRLEKIASKTFCVFIVHKNYYAVELKYKEIGEICNKRGREQNMSIISVPNPEGIDFL